MKGAYLTSLKKPFEFRDMPIPEPGSGQVRIKMAASGVCGTDVHVWHGLFPVNLPIVPGHEPVGTIDKLGAGVTHLGVGERVGVSWVQKGCGRCAYCERDKVVYCAEQTSWMNYGGGHQEFMIADAAGVTRLP